MQEYAIFILGNIFSCSITTFLVFQYLNEMYERRYQNQAVYLLLQIAISGGMVCVNLLNNPVMNLIGWITGFGIVSIKFYDAYEKKAVRRILEVAVLFLVLAICESVGLVLVEAFVLNPRFITIPPLVAHSLKVIVAYVSVLICYYLFISRIWKSGKQIKLTKAQYLVYSLILIYSMINMLLIAVLLSTMKTMNPGEISLLCINMFVIVFTDLFFLYFTKFTEENGKLKMKLNLLEQQAHIQYEYYASQEEKYNESMAILHEVGRHLNMIEGIYEAERANEAKEYTGEIREILQPLIPQQYTNNPILNILLNDKKRSAVSYDINFQLEIGNVSLSFMEPLEITTVFGNLLDNAIEACQQVEKNRYITLRLDTYNDFTAVYIINSSSGRKEWRGGKPVSQKAGNHGIGLINVEHIVKKYNGNIIFEETERTFSCKIIWNE